MRHTAARTRFLPLTLALGAAGCLPSIDSLDSGPLNKTFAVSDFYTPSGFMGDGANFRHLYLDTGQNCKEPRPPSPRGQCFTFTYFKDTTPTGVSWAGAFWVFPANNWGTRRGHAIDTTKFHSIHYYASIEYPPIPPNPNSLSLGPEPPKITYGIQNNAKTYADIVSGSDFPKMDSTMREYWLPFPDGVPGTPDDSLIGAFGWAVAFPNGADPKVPLVMHFDDIVWDTAEPPPSVTQ
jgi:hypothetical protein